MRDLVHITYRHMDASEALNEEIHRHVEAILQLADRPTSCHVVIEKPHRHQRQGNHFVVHVELVHARGHVVAGKDRPGVEHEDAFAAATEAFRALRHQLERQRRDHEHESIRTTRDVG